MPSAPHRSASFGGAHPIGAPAGLYERQSEADAEPPRTFARPAPPRAASATLVFSTAARPAVTAPHRRRFQSLESVRSPIELTVVPCRCPVNAVSVFITVCDAVARHRRDVAPGGMAARVRRHVNGRSSPAFACRAASVASRRRARRASVPRRAPHVAHAAHVGACRRALVCAFVRVRARSCAFGASYSPAPSRDASVRSLAQRLVAIACSPRTACTRIRFPGA